MNNTISGTPKHEAEGYKQYCQLRDTCISLGKKLGLVIWTLNNPNDERVYFNYTTMRDLKDNPPVDGKNELEVIRNGTAYFTLQTTVDDHKVGFYIQPGDGETYHINPYIDGKFIGHTIYFGIDKKGEKTSSADRPEIYLPGYNKSIDQGSDDIFKIFIGKDRLYIINREKERQALDDLIKKLDTMGETIYRPTVNSLGFKIKSLFLSKSDIEYEKQKIWDNLAAPLHKEHKNKLDEMTSTSDDYTQVNTYMELVNKGLEVVCGLLEKWMGEHQKV